MFSCARAGTAELSWTVSDGQQNSAAPARRPVVSVKARLLDKVSAIGRKCSDTFRNIKDRFIHHDDVFGNWNYVVDARAFS
jgi:hypothetical protein